MASVAPFRSYSFQSPWDPVSGEPTARVVIYRQGATVATATTIANGSSTAVPVADVGAISVGDEVHIGLLGPSLSVTAVTPPPIR